MMFLWFVLGLCIGSFLGVLIDRMPEGEDVVWKPSHCDFCKKRLRWFELIPVLSFILSGGKCLRCNKKLSMQYPIVELSTALGFVMIFLRFYEFPILLFSYSLIFAAALVIFMIDAKHQIIPDSMLFVMIAGALFFSISLSHVLVACISGLFFYLLWFATKGKGLGFGDVKLAAVMGFLLGHPGAIIAFYVAFLTGAFWGVILMIGGRARIKSRIAFGPFLILGIFISVAWGSMLWQWWLTML